MLDPQRPANRLSQIIRLIISIIHYGTIVESTVFVYDTQPIMTYEKKITVLL